MTAKKPRNTSEEHMAWLGVVIECEMRLLPICEWRVRLL